MSSGGNVMAREGNYGKEIVSCASSDRGKQRRKKLDEGGGATGEVGGGKVGEHKGSRGWQT